MAYRPNTFYRVLCKPFYLSVFFLTSCQLKKPTIKINKHYKHKTKPTAFRKAVSVYF